MSDLIDRQSLLDNLNRFAPEKYNALVNDLIMKEPAVQPEAIRCRDCRFNDGTAYCVFHFRDVKGEDFCSWAERRTDG